MAATARTDPNLSASWSRKATILLVEDDVLVRYATADFLRGDGHEVIEAANGHEALSLINAGVATDLVISVIGLPGSPDSMELVRLARAKNPALPVLLAAAQFPQGTSAEAAFQAKPYNYEALRQTVQMLIRNG